MHFPQRKIKYIINIQKGLQVYRQETGQFPYLYVKLSEYQLEVWEQLRKSQDKGCMSWKSFTYRKEFVLQKSVRREKIKGDKRRQMRQLIKRKTVPVTKGMERNCTNQYNGISLNQRKCVLLVFVTAGQQCHLKHLN